MYNAKRNINILKLRAAILEKTRAFFNEKNILEVETPVLSPYPAIEPYLDPFETKFFPAGYKNKGKNFAGIMTLYLHSSPEYAMKRLLSLGLGNIYQISHVFRNGERGKLHNPEFTMIEWYRKNFSLTDIMEESSEFIKKILGISKATILTTYQDAFSSVLSINPHEATAGSLLNKAKELRLSYPSSLGCDRDGWLNYLFSEKIEPYLGFDTPTIIYNYPASQAALSRINPGPPPVAERFELYINGIELCNGYHELIDHKEQLDRFQKENSLRKRYGKRELIIDKGLIKALRHGIPPCSGVAFGFDRIVMLAADAAHIDEVIPLSFKDI